MRTVLYLSIIIGLVPFLLARNTCEDMNLQKKMVKKPLSIFSGLLLLSFIVILMSANRYGYDAKNFNIFYNAVVNTGKNPWDYSYEMFGNLISLFRPFLKDISYYLFHAIMVAVIGLILIIFYSQYVTSFHATAFIYLISGIYAQDGMQIKNFISVAFLLVGIVAYIKYDGTKKYILFYAFMIAATLMHFSFFVYFIIPLIETNFFGKRKIFFPLLGTLLYLIIYLSGGGVLRVLYEVLSRIPMLNKIARYRNISAGLRSVILVLIYWGLLVVLYLCRNEISNLSVRKVKLYNFVWNVWILVGVLLPALLNANAVYRIYRNLYIIVFMVFSNSVVSLPRLSKKRILLSTIIIITAAVLYNYIIILGSSIDIYTPVIEGKFFWEG